MIFLNKIYTSAKWSVRTLAFLIFIALFGNIITSERANALLPPLIPYSATSQDAKNMDYISPLAAQEVPSLYYKHWLGTDKLGRDVFAGIVSGTRTALLVGIGGMGIALIIGLLMGLVAGYYGNNRFKLSWIGLILRGCMIFSFIFYLSVFFQQGLNPLVLMLIFIAIFICIKIGESFLKKWNPIKNTVQIPFETIIMRMVEVVQAVPSILWLLGLIAVTGRMSIIGLVCFIGFTGWTLIARLVRGEVIRVRQLEYVETAQALGFSDFRILIKHILPNILTPVLIAVSFGIANSILLEAFLTFSGLGLPIEQVTWGSLLNAAKDDFQAWWMVVFPGIAIFITVTIFNRIGEAMSER